MKNTPAIAFEYQVAAGICGSYGLSVCDNFELEDRSLTVRDARSWRFAFHSQTIRANGWQPFDQPSSAAYLPLSFRQLDQMNAGKNGLLLFQKDPAIGTICAREVTSGKDQGCLLFEETALPNLEKELARLLAFSGVPELDIGQALRLIRDRYLPRLIARELRASVA